MEDESGRVLETLRSCLQSTLVGESQNFRSWIAASHRKFNDAQRLALATTAIACLVSLGVVLAGIGEAHRLMRQAQTQAPFVQGQAVSAADPFVKLRQGNWEPVGSLITQQGRTFIELKAAK
jgi:hypothetical protein